MSALQFTPLSKIRNPSEWRRHWSTLYLVNLCKRQGQGQGQSERVVILRESSSIAGQVAQSNGVYIDKAAYTQCFWLTRVAGTNDHHQTLRTCFHTATLLVFVAYTFLLLLLRFLKKTTTKKHGTVRVSNSRRIYTHAQTSRKTGRKRHTSVLLFHNLPGWINRASPVSR